MDALLVSQELACLSAATTLKICRIFWVAPFIIQKYPKNCLVIRDFLSCSIYLQKSYLVIRDVQKCNKIPQILNKNVLAAIELQITSRDLAYWNLRYWLTVSSRLAHGYTWSFFRYTWSFGYGSRLAHGCLTVVFPAGILLATSCNYSAHLATCYWAIEFCEKTHPWQAFAAFAACLAGQLRPKRCWQGPHSKGVQGREKQGLKKF